MYVFNAFYFYIECVEPSNYIEPKLLTYTALKVMVMDVIIYFVRWANVSTS